MKLFSRLKDYNNLAEEILDKKTFSSMAKSLLLSMIYKLEISYRDYLQVKVDSISKDDFFKNILNIIKNYCDNIKIVEPESSQATLLAENNVLAVTNTKERSILVYPTEQAMLYALADIEPKYFYIKDEFVFKNTLQKLLVEGYKQNTLEVLKNFNGWSWDINPGEQLNYTLNLIYQNIMMIKGEEFLRNWRTDNEGKKDYLSVLKQSIKKITGNDNYYLSLCKLLYILADSKEKVDLDKKLKKNDKKYQEFLKQSDEFKKENARQFYKYKSYHDILINGKSEFSELIDLQKYFLKFIEKKIEKVSLREDMLEIIYELRLYQNQIISQGTFIKDCKELQNALDNTLKIAFTKSCKLGLIKIISMDIQTNFEILKFILDTKIIDLEEIKISLEIEKDEILVKVYDKKFFEKQTKIKLEDSKKDIVVKQKKMIKVFN